MTALLCCSVPQVLEQDDTVCQLAAKLYTSKSLLVMGRGYSYATCLEAALKIKELTYMHRYSWFWHVAT